MKISIIKTVLLICILLILSIAITPKDQLITIQAETVQSIDQVHYSEEGIL